MILFQLNNNLILRSPFSTLAALACASSPSRPSRRITKYHDPREKPAESSISRHDGICGDARGLESLAPRRTRASCFRAPSNVRARCRTRTRCATRHIVQSQDTTGRDQWQAMLPGRRKVLQLGTPVCRELTIRSPRALCTKTCARPNTTQLKRAPC